MIGIILSDIEKANSRMRLSPYWNGMWEGIMQPGAVWGQLWASWINKPGPSRLDFDIQQPPNFMLKVKQLGIYSWLEPFHVIALFIEPHITVNKPIESHCTAITIWFAVQFALKPTLHNNPSFILTSWPFALYIPVWVSIKSNGKQWRLGLEPFLPHKLYFHNPILVLVLGA